MTSRLAPVVEERQRRIIAEALRLINSSGKHFPCANDYDPSGQLNGSFLAIEGKHILIGAMNGGHWNDLVKNMKKFKISMTDPADVFPGQDITATPWWPEDASAEGKIGYAIDYEANAIAKLAFERLVLAAKAKRVRKPKPKTKIKKKVVVDDDEEYEKEDSDTDADEQVEEMDVAIKPISQISDNQDPGVVRAAEDIDMSEPVVRDMPDPGAVGRNFRMTRDWKDWPTTGVLESQVSDYAQAEYGIIADALFESMKVTKVKKSGSSKAKSDISGQTGSRKSLSGTVQTIVQDETAMPIIVELLQAHIDAGGKPVLRNSTKGGPPQSQAFRNSIMSQDQIQYDTAEGPATIQDTLRSLTEPDLEALYIAACKARAKASKEAAGDDAGDDPKDQRSASREPETPSGTRGRGRAGSRGSATSATRARGRGRPRAGSTTARATPAPQAGTKRKRAPSPGEEEIVPTGTGEDDTALPDV